MKSEKSSLPDKIQIKETAMAVAKKETNRWLTHYANDIKGRIPMSMITLQQGLADPRLFMLRKHQPELELVAVLSAQIDNLGRFLNIKNNLSNAQIVDTAELILQEFDDMSFTAIADCFNRIKVAKPPFDKALYQSLDGRIIMEYLHLYRNHQIEELEVQHIAVKNSEAAFRHLIPEGFDAADALSELSQKLRIDSVLAKIEKEKGKPTPEDLSKMDAQVKIWISEFHEMSSKRQMKTGQQPYHGELDDFLNNKIKQLYDEKTPPSKK